MRKAVQAREFEMRWTLKTLAFLIAAISLTELRSPLSADDQLQYGVEILEPPRAGPENGAQFNRGLIRPEQLGGPKPSREIRAQVSLTNIGTTEQVVYWPTGSAVDVFQFELIHVATGQRIPVVASSSRAPQRPPTAVASNLFRRLSPGQSITQLIRIDGRGSGPHAILRKPGTYQLVARLKLSIHQAFDEKTGRVASVPDVWTGSLKAEPVELKIEEGVENPGQHAALNGRVRSHDGSPIADAVVQLRFSSAPNSKFDSRHAEEWESVLTDASGRFCFLDVPDESDYSFTITCPDYRRGYLVYSHDEFLSSKPVFIEIARTYLVRGQIVDRAGQGLAMVRVNSNCYSDQNGRFEMNVSAPKDEAPLRLSLWRRGLVARTPRIPWQDAIATELRLTMFTNEELSVKGQAWFEDDQPVANATLYFNLSWLEGQTSRPLSTTQVRAETDAHGDFVVVLPSNDEFRASIEIEEPQSRSGAARRWTRDVDRLKPGAPPLQLHFDNRGRIIVRIFQGTKLTSSQKVAISIYSMSRNRNVASQRLSDYDLGCVFDGLEPGDSLLPAAGFPKHIIASFDPSQLDGFDGSIYSKTPSGSIHISGLGPGAYQLDIAVGELRSSFDLQLQPQEHQRLVLRLESNGTLVSVPSGR